MRSSKPSSRSSDEPFFSRIRGIGAALRGAFSKAARDVDTPAVMTALDPPPPSNSVEQARDRVHRSAQALDLVAALTLNPLDPAAVDAGIENAMRRLAEDVYQ